MALKILIVPWPAELPGYVLTPAASAFLALAGGPFALTTDHTSADIIVSFGGKLQYKNRVEFFFSSPARGGHATLRALSDRGVRLAAALARDMSRVRRVPLPASMLRLGTECGHSDATSGLGANPLAGLVADRLVDAGGAAVFGETMEWLGAEHVLASRAQTPEVGRAIVDAVAQRERWAAATGEDLTGNNPGAENIRGGLSSIEEKSLGAIAKGGSRPVRGVLPHAAPIPGPGLWVMEGPSFSPPSVTGFVAAGCNMTMFTTGPGNSYCDALAPTVKVTVNPKTAARLHHQIDFDGSGLMRGTREPEDAADALFAQLLDHASGTRTWGEVLDEGGYAFARLGADF